VNNKVHVLCEVRQKIKAIANIISFKYNFMI
jgi:hypothetical protein